VVNLAGIDQLAAPAPAEIQPVPFLAVEREPGDGQRLTLGAGLLDPIVGPSGRIFAVSHFGNDALKARLASVLVHLLAVDLERVSSR
jgi:hypothetical protein